MSVRYHSKNKPSVLENATPGLGVKSKRGWYVFWLLFFKTGLCSVTSFKRSRRELSINVAKLRSTLKNYQSTHYPRFLVLCPKAFPKAAFFCDDFSLISWIKGLNSNQWTITLHGVVTSFYVCSSYRKVSPAGENPLHSTLTNGSNADVSAAAASIGGLGPALGPALVGAELLRMAGGPGRGWYPRHRHPRPASIEHLDRVPPHHSPSGHSPWDARDARKPMTLPPNMTPKFFHRSPREALRRVTSLLIRAKGECHS